VRTEIYVDGQWQGSVGHTSERSFSVGAGFHTVEGFSGGERLFREQVHLSPRNEARVRVEPLAQATTFVHRGDTAVFVQLPGVQGFWLQPGQRKVLSLRMGSLRLETSIQGRHGMRNLAARDLNIQRGRNATIDVGYTAPQPSTTTITNNRNHTVRVYIADKQVTALRAGETARIAVSQGDHAVLVVSQQGAVLYNQDVRFERGQQRSLVVNRNGVEVPSEPCPMTRPGYSNGTHNVAWLAR